MDIPCPSLSHIFTILLHFVSCLTPSPRSISSRPTSFSYLSLSLALSPTFFARFLREFIIYKGESTPRACFVLRCRRLREIAHIFVARVTRSSRPRGWFGRGGPRVKTCLPLLSLPLCIKYPAITVITVTVLCEIARLPHRGLRPVAAYANAIFLWAADITWTVYVDSGANRPRDPPNLE